MNKPMQYEDRVVWASGHFLADSIPLELFNRGNDDELLQWIDDHPIEAFEYIAPETIWDMIDTLASQVIEVVQNK